VSEQHAKAAGQPPIIFTIGHSTRTLEEFIELVSGHGVQAVADVRQYPRSRRLPHFNDDSLAQHLPKAGIKYVPLKALGGRRKTSADSINLGWRNESFRGYADFMQTPEFGVALNDLIELAARRPTAIMCAEAVPWRCHRSLIADALLIRGLNVLDILSPAAPKAHKLTPFAKVDGLQLTYPQENDQGLFAAGH